MSNKQAEDWSTYWKGRRGSEAGTALIGAGVETDKDISAFWSETLQPFDRNQPVLDLACGAGSVLRVAAELGFTNLSGVDISPEAIDALTQSIPQAKGYVRAANATEFPDNSFSVVTSQFGFEYAGAIETAKEIGRILTPGGNFIAMAHINGGAIEEEVKTHRNHCSVIATAGFFPAVRDVVRLAFKLEETESQFTRNELVTASRELQKVSATINELAQIGNKSAQHLLNGTNQLLERRRAYDAQDIYDWLDGMEAENAAHQGRMQSMLNATLSERQVKAVLAALEAAGIPPQPTKAFAFAGDDAPAAWIIRAG